MAYKMELPPETLKRCYLLKEYCAGGPIIQQVRTAVEQFLKQKEIEIGTTVEDIAETLEKEKEERLKQDYDNLLSKQP